MDNRRRTVWTTDNRGVLVGGPQTADGEGPSSRRISPVDIILLPCFHPSPLLLSLPLSSIPPPVVIPETGGLNFCANENASSARYPGSPQGWLLWTKESDHG